MYNIGRTSIAPHFQRLLISVKQECLTYRAFGEIPVVKIQWIFTGMTGNNTGIIAMKKPPGLKPGGLFIEKTS
ncbi:MAG: hypothetical protein GY839_01995 [candidate division Zixibacteria bacterium]|nr:hypothetical protein [candidate division Zixibacteria bacterium]